MMSAKRDLQCSYTSQWCKQVRDWNLHEGNNIYLYLTFEGPNIAPLLTCAAGMEAEEGEWAEAFIWFACQCRKEISRHDKNKVNCVTYQPNRCSCSCQGETITKLPIRVGVIANEIYYAKKRKMEKNMVVVITPFVPLFVLVWQSYPLIIQQICVSMKKNLKIILPIKRSQSVLLEQSFQNHLKNKK